MAEVYTYDGTHLVLVRDGEAEFTQSAEFGNVGNGRLGIDDTAGTLSIVGQKDFLHTESACSFTRTFRGFIADRTYGRNAGTDRAPHVGAARGIDVQLEDLNSMLGHRMLRDHGTTAAQNGKRPAETVAERLEWLMSNHAMNLIDDNGRIDYVTTKGMDKADYRGQFPGDVLADCALAAGGYNYYVRDFGSGPELVFRDDNASNDDTSTLRISNVLSDASAVTLHPFRDATLRRDPSRVRSVIRYDHAKGTVTEERAATATAFNGERAGNASNSNVKSDGKARNDAERMLYQLSTEEDVIECTCRVTAAQVNLLMQGDRVECKFSHLATEGYGSFVWMRVLERTVKPVNAEAADYELRLKMSPQEPAEAAPGDVAIVQGVSGFWGTGGSGSAPYTHLPNPPTIGNTLVVLISTRAGGPGSGEVVAPNTSAGLPRWGAGAWTELPLDVGAFTSTFVENTAGDGVKHGMSIFWKTVDSTEQDCAILNDYENLAAFELSGADMASVSVLARANNQAPNTNFDCGTLGTVASTDMAFMVVHSVPDDVTPIPPVVPAAGWNVALYNGSYPIWYATTYPVAWIGYAYGAGAVIDPSVNRGASRRFCGLAFVVPAL